VGQAQGTIAEELTIPGQDEGSCRDPSGFACYLGYVDGVDTPYRRTPDSELNILPTAMDVADARRPSRITGSCWR